MRVALGLGFRLTFRELGASLLIIAVVQGVVLLAAAPLLLGVVELALRAAGLRAVTNTTVLTLLQAPWAVALMVSALVLVILLLLAQLGVFLEAAKARLTGEPARLGAVLRRAGSRALLLARKPSTLLLIPYFLLLIPLGQVAFTSVLTRWIAVPAFVSGELEKEPATAVAYYALLAVIWYLNLRFLLTLPLVVMRDLPVGAALRESWRTTGWIPWRVLTVVLAAVAPALVAVFAVHLLVLLPTWLADVAAPDTAVVVAAIGLGAAQIAVFLIAGLVLLVEATALSVLTGADISPSPAAAPVPVRGRRAVRVLAGAGAAVVAVGLGAGYIAPALEDVSDGSTLVLAHRGFTAEGVENTIPALEAAHAAGADLVEMDVLQTKDRRWVVMHDANLGRLAGENVAVADLTLAELTAMTVRSEGHEARIPSLEEYLARADEIGQPLLIEIKIHGRESPDYIDGLLDVLDRVDGADQHIYHTLSADVVEGFTERRPELTIGYIVALAFGSAVDSPAAFLVYEESSYTSAVRDEAHAEGKGIFVWTVNEEGSMRELFRQNVDGIITDHPDVALRALDHVADESGMLDKLWDALDRLVVD